MPANFDREAVRKKIKLPADDGPAQTEPARDRQAGRQKHGANSPKPAFTSQVVSLATKGHAVEIDADITGAKQLFLVVTDGGDGFGCDWADWAEPRLVGPDGREEADRPEVEVGRSGLRRACSRTRTAAGSALKINGKTVEYGIGTHAN